MDKFDVANAELLSKYYSSVDSLYHKFCKDRFYKHLLMYFHANDIVQLTNNQREFLEQNNIFCTCLESDAKDSGFDSSSCNNSKMSIESANSHTDGNQDQLDESFQVLEGTTSDKLALAAQNKWTKISAEDETHSDFVELCKPCDQSSRKINTNADILQSNLEKKNLKSSPATKSKQYNKSGNTG